MFSLLLFAATVSAGATRGQTAAPRALLGFNLGELGAKLTGVTSSAGGNLRLQFKAPSGAGQAYASLASTSDKGQIVKTPDGGFKAQANLGAPFGFVTVVCRPASGGRGSDIDCDIAHGCPNGSELTRLLAAAKAGRVEALSFFSGKEVSSVTLLCSVPLDMSHQAAKIRSKRLSERWFGSPPFMGTLREMLDDRTSFTIALLPFRPKAGYPPDFEGKKLLSSVNFGITYHKGVL